MSYKAINLVMDSLSTHLTDNVIYPKTEFLVMKQEAAFLTSRASFHLINSGQSKDLITLKNQYFTANNTNFQKHTGLECHFRFSFQHTR